MLAGLSPLELGRLRMSVGYGTHKKGRWYSPIEVGILFRRACDSGASPSDCATEARIDGTGVGRFFRILNLPQDLQHLVNWGSGKDAIGFSTAAELVRLQDDEEQRIVAKSILVEGLNSKEVRQVVQLRTRSGRPIHECLKEVLGMRPTIERRYVFIGSVIDQRVEEALIDLTQMKRNAILTSAIKRIGLQGASGRLGKRFFTLVGDDRFDASMQSIGKENIETRLRIHIAEAVQDV